MRLFLDTNAVIDLLKGDADILSQTNKAEVVFISVITTLEFFSFSELSQNDKRLFARFEENLTVLDITKTG